jgi:hypothetical protein
MDQIWEEAQEGFEATLWSLRRLADVLVKVGHEEDSRALYKAGLRVQNDILPLLNGVYDEAQVEREEEG